MFTRKPSSFTTEILMWMVINNQSFNLLNFYAPSDATGSTSESLRQWAMPFASSYHAMSFNITQNSLDGTTLFSSRRNAIIMRTITVGIGATGFFSAIQASPQLFNQVDLYSFLGDSTNSTTGLIRCVGIIYRTRMRI